MRGSRVSSMVKTANAALVPVKDAMPRAAVKAGAMPWIGMLGLRLLGQFAYLMRRGQMRAG